MIEDCGSMADPAGGIEDGPEQGRSADPTSPRPVSATPAPSPLDPPTPSVPEHPPGSTWTDNVRVYTIAEKPSKWAGNGLITALLDGDVVLIREADLGVRIHRTEDR